MDTPSTAKNWRLNAQPSSWTADGYVLLGKDNGRNPYWHFPQGGVIKNESIERGARAGGMGGSGPASHGIHHCQPPPRPAVQIPLRQPQSHALDRPGANLLPVRCKARRPKTDLHRSPEFSKTKWIPLQDLKLEMFPKFKRKVIKDALQQFFGPDFPAKPAAMKTSSTSSPASSTLTSHTMNRYLVPPGKKLRLKDYSPDDKSLFSGTKEESLVEFDKLREELQELQKKLFAQHKHRVLVILQAMDAGGKDGCVQARLFPGGPAGAARGSL